MAGSADEADSAAAARAEMLAIAENAEEALVLSMELFRAAYYRGLPRYVQVHLRGITAGSLAKFGESTPVSALYCALGNILSLLPDVERDILVAFCEALGWNKISAEMKPRDLWEVASANDNQFSEKSHAGLIGVRDRLITALPRLELARIDDIQATLVSCEMEWADAIDLWIGSNLPWALFLQVKKNTMLRMAVRRHFARHPAPY